MLHSRLRIDRSQVPANQPCRRHLIFEIEAPTRDVTPDPDTPKLPLDLALVIDRSGSMAGPRLAAAKQAAIEVVRHLSPEDRLTLVSFHSNVRVHLDGLAMTEVNRARAAQTIDSLRPGGSTNLSGGWITAAETMLASPGEGPRRRHCVLLSDGRANVGITDPTHLGDQAATFLDRGVSTTAVGIGDNYSSTQLAALAEFGGGRLHDAEHPTFISERILGELGELGEVAAEGIELELEVPRGMRASDLSGTRSRVLGRILRVPVGAIRFGGVRTLVLGLDIESPLEDGEHLPISARLRWKTAETGEAGHDVLHATLAATSGPCAPATEADMRIVLGVWSPGLEREFMELNERGLFDEVHGLWVSQWAMYEDYFGAYPELMQSAAQVREVYEQAVTPMGARARKDVHLMAFKRGKGERAWRNG